MNIITKLTLDGYEIPVPHGLSELMEGAWVAEKTVKPIPGYESFTEMKNGRLVTIIKEVKHESMGTGKRKSNVSKAN